MIQLPDDVVSVGYTQVRPYQYEQVFRSQSLDFVGTAQDFLEAGLGYTYVQLDAYTRRVL